MNINLTSVVFAPRFNLCFPRLTVQFSTVKIVQHVFFQPITRTTNLKPIVNAYRSLSLVLSYRIIISWAYLFSFFFCAWKAPGSCSRTWNRAHVFRAWFRVHVFRTCLRAYVFRAWPVANALKRHTFQTEIKSILYCNDQRFD